MFPQLAAFTDHSLLLMRLLVGLILLTAVVARIGQGGYRNGDHSGPEATIYYWHFVDAVWVAVFATIYLIR